MLPQEHHSFELSSPARERRGRIEKTTANRRHDMLVVVIALSCTLSSRFVFSIFWFAFVYSFILVIGKKRDQIYENQRASCYGEADSYFA